MSTRERFVASMIAAILSGLACTAILMEPRWFQHLFSRAADGGDGRLETLVAAVVSLAAFLFFGLLAWSERRLGQREAARRAMIVKDLA